MTELVITRGLPASGKSSWAREQVRNDIGNTVRVNRDLLRIMLNDDIFVKGVTESVTVRARNVLVEAFLKQSKTVICDDTNLASSMVRELARLAEKHGASVRVVDFDVDVEECVLRDAEREFKGEITVGENVVRDMYTRYFAKGFPKNPLDREVAKVMVEPYIAREGVEKVIIVDMDGTVANHEGKRSPYDYTQVHLDDPRHGVIETVCLYADAGYKVLFLSGRESSCMQQTANWIEKHIKVDFDLFMRKTGDQRADYIVKLELFNEHVRDNYNVVAVFDDRDQVIKLWRELGLNTYQVNYGDF